MPSKVIGEGVKRVLERKGGPLDLDAPYVVKTAE